MEQRILLLPGFGEDAFIFDKIRVSFKEYNLIDVNYRKSFDKISYSKIDVWLLAKDLINEYQITSNDILIGHSMGGYFSFVIREMISCEIVMIASFNDPDKVRRIIYNKAFNISLAKLGLLKMNGFQNFLLKPSRGKYFEKEIEKVIRNFSKFSKSQLTKMLKLSFGDKIVSKLDNPLRIHAKNDTVVRPPNESYIECKLGHFCLTLEEDVISEIIFDYLNIK